MSKKNECCPCPDNMETSWDKLTLEQKSRLKICVGGDKMSKKSEDELKRIIATNSGNNGRPLVQQKLQAAFMISKLWPKNSTIRVSFIDTPANKMAEWTSLQQLQNQRDSEGNKLVIDPIEDNDIRKLSNKDAVIKVVKERIDPICGLTFEFVDGIGDIRVAFEVGKGSWSLLGTDCTLQTDPNMPTMNFGWMDTATIMHEFCHAIGMIHEHQNPFGEGIPWNENAVYDWAKMTQGWDQELTYNNILKKYDVDQINGSEYDPKSIMLYFFPGALTTTGVGTTQNRIFSDKDIEFINKMYPGAEVEPTEFVKSELNREFNSNVNDNTMNGPKMNDNKMNTFFILLVIIVFIFGVYYLGKWLSSEPVSTSNNNKKK